MERQQCLFFSTCQQWRASVQKAGWHRETDSVLRSHAATAARPNPAAPKATLLERCSHRRCSCSTSFSPPCGTSPRRCCCQGSLISPTPRKPQQTTTELQLTLWYFSRSLLAISVVRCSTSCMRYRASMSLYCTCPPSSRAWFTCRANTRACTQAGSTHEQQRRRKQQPASGQQTEERQRLLPTRFGRAGGWGRPAPMPPSRRQNQPSVTPTHPPQNPAHPVSDDIHPPLQLVALAAQLGEPPLQLPILLLNLGLVAHLQWTGIAAQRQRLEGSQARQAGCRAAYGTVPAGIPRLAALCPYACSACTHVPC